MLKFKHILKYFAGSGPDFSAPYRTELRENNILNVFTGIVDQPNSGLYGDSRISPSLTDYMSSTLAVYSMICYHA